MATRAIDGTIGARRPTGARRSAVACARARQMAGAAAAVAARCCSSRSRSPATPRPTRRVSTAAAGDDVRNWMGPPGAWAAERVLLPVRPGLGALLLPLLYVVRAQAVARCRGRGRRTERTALVAAARRCCCSRWRCSAPCWRWRSTARGGTLPASMGGIAGLLGARAVTALGERLAEAAQRLDDPRPRARRAWRAAVAGLARVFALDWARAADPAALRHARAARCAAAPASTSRSCRGRAARRQRDAAPTSRRRSPAPARPRSADPDAAPPRAARWPARPQKDLFDNYELPSLDLLADPPPHTAPKLDKLALERNARLLETVLDDFNVKGEITAVRTGPVVTMYELEPAPGDQGQPGDRPGRRHRPQHERDLRARLARSPAAR